MDNKKLNEQELEQVSGGVVPDSNWQVVNASPHGCVSGENNGIIINNSDISADSNYGAGIGGGAVYPSVNLPAAHDSGTHNIEFDK